MNLLWTILYFIAMFLVILLVYALCKMYVFSKIRVNKWVPLCIAVGLFIIQLFVGPISKSLNLVFTGVTVLFVLWFFEILQTGGPKKKEKKIVIKPKAKPNRVKKNKK